MKTSTKLLIGVCIMFLISLGVIYWLWTHPKIEKQYVPISGKTELPAITYTKGENGNQVATIKTPSPVLEPAKVASEELLNTVKNIKELNEKDAKITELTRIITQLQVQLSDKDLIVNDKEKQLKTWKDKFNEITVDNANNTASVKSDVSPVIAEYTKRPQWYKPRQGYLAVTSQNPSITFNGVEKYEVKKSEIKNIFEITANVAGGQYILPKPYQNFNFYSSELELTLNPDGRIKPFANLGFRTDFQWYSPYWSAGVKVLILKY